LKISNLFFGIILLVGLYIISVPEIRFEIYGFPVVIPNLLHALWDWGIPLFVVPYSIPLPFIIGAIGVICIITAFRSDKTKHILQVERNSFE